MQRTRQRILEQLESQRSATPAELSRALDMTAANMRHHLAVMEEAGLVQAVGEKPSGGRGRPSQVYMCTPQAEEDNLGQLASAALRVLGSTQSMKQLAEKLGGEQGAAFGPLAQRLYKAVQRLNELKYKARWEAHAEAPHLILERCPYAAIIDQHPELCQMDALLLEGLTGEAVQQIAKLEHGLEGPPHCIFVAGGAKGGQK